MKKALLLIAITSSLFSYDSDIHSHCEPFFIASQNNLSSQSHFLTLSESLGGDSRRVAQETAEWYGDVAQSEFERFKECEKKHGELSVR